MKILSRFVITLLVLGGLAFGSYTVGKHFLSRKLFGNGVRPRAGSGLSTNGAPTNSSPRNSAPDKTRARDANSQNRDVQVQVMPPQNDVSSDDTPTFSDLQRASKKSNANRSNAQMDARRKKTEKLVRADSLPVPNARLSGNALNDNTIDGVNEARRERRRKRKRRRNVELRQRRENRRSDSSSSQNARSNDRRDTNSSDSGSSNRSSGSDSSRTNSSSEGGSPVPRAESSNSQSSGNNGGDSPVPQPE